MKERTEGVMTECSGETKLAGEQRDAFEDVAFDHNSENVWPKS